MIYGLLIVKQPCFACHDILLTTVVSFSITLKSGRVVITDWRILRKKQHSILIHWGKDP